MGFEIPVDVDYFSHPKTLKLVSILGQRADIYPLRVWAWASRYARDGVLEGKHRAMELAAGWKQPAGKLVASMQEAGFITADGKNLHDWMKGIGRAIAIYDEKKRKMRDKYDQSSRSLPEEFRKSGVSILPIRDGTTTTGGDNRDTQDNPPQNGQSATPPSTAPEARPHHPLLDGPNYIKGLSLLLSIGFKGQMADNVAQKLRLRRIIEVVEASKTQQNPAGWARQAFKETWEVPAIDTQRAETLLGESNGRS